MEIQQIALPPAVGQHAAEELARERQLHMEHKTHQNEIELDTMKYHASAAKQEFERHAKMKLEEEQATQEVKLAKVRAEQAVIDAQSRFKVQEAEAAARASEWRALLAAGIDQERIGILMSARALEEAARYGRLIVAPQHAFAPLAMPAGHLDNDMPRPRSQSPARHASPSRHRTRAQAHVDTSSL